MRTLSPRILRRFRSVRNLASIALATLTMSGGEPTWSQTTPFQHRWAGMVHDSFTFDGDEVWTVEDGGRIRHRSTAGGAWNFQTVPPPVKEMLRHIHFVPDSTPADGPTGWAVGDKGWILKTTNGGATWATLTTNLGAQVPAVLPAQFRKPFAPDKEALYDIFFLDESRGWMCGLHGIWRTVDGGSNWTPCSLFMQNGQEIDGAHAQALLATVEIYALDVVERGDGSLFGLASSEPGLVFKTTDGIVWQVVLDIRCMCTLAGGQGCNLPSTCTACFDCTTLPPIGGCLGAPTAPGDPQGLSCELGICDQDAPSHFEMWDVEISRNPTQNLAVACGGVGTSCGMIFTTTDDAETWTKESHECQAAGVAGGVDCSAGADTAFLYHDLPPPTSNPPPAWFTHVFRHQELSTIYGVAIFSADNSIIASGYAGQMVLRNPENGIWQDRSSFNSRIHEVDNAVTMPMNGATANTNGGSKGIAVGFGGTIRETADGGQGWSDPQNLEHCAEWRIHDLHFVDSSIGFTVGQFARVGRTVNAGIGWTTNDSVTDLHGATLWSIVFADSVRGVAVGAIASGATVPTILFTTNQGQGPTPWSAPGSISLSSGGIAGALRDVCSAGLVQTGALYWAAGDGDFILKSTDSGQTWAQVRRGAPPGQDPTVQWLGIAFKDSQTGILVGKGDPQGTGTHALAFQYRRFSNPPWSEVPTTLGTKSLLSDVVISGDTAFAVGEQTVGGVRTGIVLRSSFSSSTGFSAFAPLSDPSLPSFPLGTTNDPGTNLGTTPILIEAEIDASNGDLWVGGMCGRVWRRSSGGVWTVFQQTQTDTHIEGISIPDSTHGFFGGTRNGQPAQCIVRYNP